MTNPSPWSRPPEPPRGSRPFWPWALAIGLGLTVVVVYLASSFPEAIADTGSQARLVHNLLWLVVLGGALAVRWRAKPGRALKHAAIWVVIGAGLVLAYSFRDDGMALKDRLVGTLLPHKAIVADGVVAFRKGAGGHFIVEAEVDGVAIRFLVDTGATDITLSPADAERLGFRLEALAFNRPYATANGMVMGAPVRLREIRVGNIVMTDVRASVNGTPMNRSLLGMSFLDRLSGFEIAGDQLYLRP